MVKTLTLLLIFVLWFFPAHAPNAPGGFAQNAVSKIETVYDRSKDKTTVRLTPVKISGERGKYHSLHMSPAFSYPGKDPRVPEFIDFELRTVVKGKLKLDLYVLFIVDGEKIFISSNRWGVKEGNLGRDWMGEHLVFRMSYQTFLKIIKASSVEIKLDGISFPVGNEQRHALEELAEQIEYRSPAT
jgi:hypothetical protein